MKIVSNYCDYYDNISKIYGGDPKIVYVRPYKHIKVPVFNADKEIGKYGREYYKVDGLNRVLLLINRNNNGNHSLGVGEQTNFRVIIVGDTLFTQIKRNGDNNYRLVRENDLRNKQEKRSIWGNPIQLKITDVINYKDPLLIDICKKVGLPVFMLETEGYDRNIKLVMSDIMPNLGKVGIGNFIDANTMYQNISYLVGNLLHDSPDTMKPVIVSDKYKIIGHGFDYKTSFRGKL